MTLQELQKLFRYLENDTGRFAITNHLMFKLLATTGMRRSELVDITQERLDLFNNTIRIHGKGKKERLLPFKKIKKMSIYVSFRICLAMKVQSQPKSIRMQILNRKRTQSTPLIFLKLLHNQITTQIGQLFGYLFPFCNRCVKNIGCCNEPLYPPPLYGIELPSVFGYIFH